MRDDLYEQCSDHITEKTPSSTVFGSRPSSSFTRVNSSGVRLCAAMTSGVIDSIKSRQKAESSRQKEMTAPFCLLLAAYFLIDCRAQFGGLDLAEVLESNFTFAVVKKRRRQRAVPLLVHGMNRGLRIVDVQKHDRHRRLHLFEKIHRPGFVGHFIKRDREKIQALRAVIVVDFDQIGKLFAAAIAPRRPKINQQRPRVFRIAQQEFFQTVEINLANFWRSTGKAKARLSYGQGVDQLMVADKNRRQGRVTSNGASRRRPAPKRLPVQIDRKR